MAGLPSDVQRYWETRFAEGGKDVTALWGSQASQVARFDVLYRMSGLAALPSTAEPVVLDFGCGFGDFAGYLISKGSRARYIGMEANEQARQVAVDRYRFARFVAGERVTQYGGEVDVVVASGVFNIPCAGWMDYVRGHLAEMLQKASVGVAVNFLSTLAPVRTSEARFTDPVWALEQALLLTPKVALDHSYRANDFTLWMGR